jgi:hypothetical protein
MLNRKPYSSAIKKTPYKYAISKKIAELILKRMDKNEVFNECYNNNYINVESTDRRREITNVIYGRLISIDDTLLRAFFEGDLETSKFILVYAIAKTDSLFFDFMFEVYRDALLGNKNYISIDDFENFFIAKKEYDEIVSSWSQCTISDLTQGYRNILVDSGLGIRVKRNIKAIKPLIHPQIFEHIKNIGDGEYLMALLGVK